MSELSEALAAARRQRGGWSVRRIAEESAAAGRPLSFSTVSAYLRGRHGIPDESTLEAFAAVFPELSLATLRELAHLPSGIDEPYVPPSSANRLSRSQRAAVDAVIAAMLEERGQPPAARDRQHRFLEAARRGDIEPTGDEGS